MRRYHSLLVAVVIMFLDVAFVTRRRLRFGRLWSKFLMHSKALICRFSLLLLFSFPLQFLAALAPFAHSYPSAPRWLAGKSRTFRHVLMLLVTTTLSLTTDWTDIPCTPKSQQRKRLLRWPAVVTDSPYSVYSLADLS